MRINNCTYFLSDNCCYYSLEDMSCIQIGIVNAIWMLNDVIFDIAMQFDKNALAYHEYGINVACTV